MLSMYNIGFSQKQEIKIQYKVYPTYGSLENQEDIKNSKMSYLFEGLDKALDELRYELFIKDKKSCFMLIENMGINAKSIKMATSFAGKNDYLIDKELNKFIRKTIFFNELFYVEFIQNTQWLLLDETKIIGDYLCYKAVIKKNIVLDGKSKEYDVIAWYCPKLPYEFGPKEFGGLPGVILELQDDRITYIASKIESNKNIFKSFKIEKEIISEDKFNEIVNKKGDEFLYRTNIKN